MKPYGRDHEPPNTRDGPDVADCVNLGLPTRMHRIKSRTRRTSRRKWKQAERRAARRRLRDHY